MADVDMPYRAGNNSTVFADDDLTSLSTFSENVSNFLQFPRPSFNRIERANTIILAHNEQVDILHGRIENLRRALENACNHIHSNRAKNEINQLLVEDSLNEAIELRIQPFSTSNEDLNNNANRKFVKAFTFNNYEITTDDELFDCLKNRIAIGDISSFRRRTPLPIATNIDEIIDILKQDVIELKNTSAVALFRAFYTGRNLHFLKMKIRKDRLKLNFHRVVKQNCTISKSWTNKLIAFYLSYKSYAKLMMCNISFDSMYTIRKRIVSLMKKPEVSSWYNALTI